MSKKIVTTNQLSEQLERMNGRFDGIDTRLDRMDGRFDGIDTRLDRMNGRFDGIDTRLDRMDGRFDGNDSRLDGMDSRFDEMVEFLAENAVTRKELGQALQKQKLEIIYAIDDKLGDLKGDLVAAFKRTDEKSNAIVDTLTKKRIFTKKEGLAIRILKPFSR